MLSSRSKNDKRALRLVAYCGVGSSANIRCARWQLPCMQLVGQMDVVPVSSMTLNLFAGCFFGSWQVRSSH